LNDSFSLFFASSETIIEEAKDDVGMAVKGMTSIDNLLQELAHRLPLGLLCTQDGRTIIYCNECAQGILGLPKTQILGSDMQDFFGLLSEQDYAQLRQPQGRLNKFYKDEMFVLRAVDVKDGCPGVVFYLVQAVQTDEQASSALAMSQALTDELEGILNSAYDDMMITDKEGRVMRASKSVSRTYGIPHDQLLVSNVYELQKQGIFKPSITALVLKEKSRQIVVQETLSGNKILSTGVPVFNDQSEIERVVSYSYDVTELVELRKYAADIEAEMSRVKTELEQLRSKEVNIDGIVAASPQMRKFMGMAAQVAKRDVSVLLLGESGVGKGVFARYIHRTSSRSDAPFIEINCGAVPESLMESEFFGYEEGAFTGAKKTGRVGLLELASDGTLFLDEIAELPLSLQVKLLKVIQERRFLRVGGRKVITSNFRLLAATNRDLEAMVRTGAFREDLYFRLNIVPLHIPPLRERKEDIVELTKLFTSTLNEKHGLQKQLSVKVLQHFMEYPWPGNVRELENLIERLLVLAESDTINVEDLPTSWKFDTPSLEVNDVGQANLTEQLAQYERALFMQARQKCRTTVEMAKYLGISQPTVVRKLQKYFPAH